MKRIPRLFLACVLTPWTVASFAAEPQGAIIFGVARLVVGTDSIQIARDDASPSGLDLIPGGAGSAAGVSSLEIKVGDSFTVSDRKHLGSIYKVLQIVNDSALIEETHWTRFPGADESRSTRTMLIRTYGMAAASR